MKKAIAVLSGGLDCTVASSVYAKDYEIHAITFNYGQKAFKRELKASKEICKKMGFSHSVIDLDWLAKISTSSLNTSEDIPEVDFNDLDDLENPVKVQAAFGYLQEILSLHPLQHLMLKALEPKSS